MNGEVEGCSGKDLYSVGAPPALTRGQVGISGPADIRYRRPGAAPALVRRLRRGNPVPAASARVLLGRPGANDQLSGVTVGALEPRQTFRSAAVAPAGQSAADHAHADRAVLGLLIGGSATKAALHLAPRVSPSHTAEGRRDDGHTTEE